jgi:hypothetical protein
MVPTFPYSDIATAFSGAISCFIQVGDGPNFSELLGSFHPQLPMLMPAALGRFKSKLAGRLRDS